MLKNTLFHRNRLTPGNQKKFNLFLFSMGYKDMLLATDKKKRSMFLNLDPKIKYALSAPNSWPAIA